MNGNMRSQKGQDSPRFFHVFKAQLRFWGLMLVPVAAVVVVLFLAGGSSQPQDVINVNLEQRSQVSPVQQMSNETYGQTGDNVLRVAVAGVLSPTKSLEYYQELLDYMGQKLDRHATLILKPTYAEVNDLMRGQRADVAFVCSFAYVKGNDDFGMELLVVPQMKGETVYYSYLIVAKEKGIASLEDLRGLSFAFSDPISNSGHLAPTYQLSLLGGDPASFFSRHIFTYSHDNSIIAVADKLVDGAAVDSLVYDKMATDDPELISKTKIIARWGPYGIPPVVISPSLDSQLKQKLLEFFLELYESSEGKGILNNLAIDKFVLVNDDIYDSIREMRTKLGW